MPDRKPKPLPPLIELVLDLGIFTPQELFEALLDVSEECPDCLRAAYADRGSYCERHQPS